MKNPVTDDQLETLVLLPDQPEERLAEAPLFERPQAPCRLLCPPRSLGAAPYPLDASALFAATRQACFLEPRRQIGPLALLGCQEVPPQAVSLRRPPARAWLLRLGWGDAEENDGPAEALVFLQEHELHLVWR